MQLTQDDRPDLERLTAKPEKLGLTPSWSYSALKVYEECPYRTYLGRVKKIKEPTSPAAQRGTDIHQEAEANCTLMQRSNSKASGDLIWTGHRLAGCSPIHGHASSSTPWY
jgi:hypothetical protein